MSTELYKPAIGFTCGDINGIGPEILIKILSEEGLINICTPVVFASTRLINFYKKAMPDYPFPVQNVKDLTKIFAGQINIIDCWEEDVQVTPGELNETGGKYALQSLLQASQALKDGLVQGIVTAPIHKKNILSNSFAHTGHTPFLKQFFAAQNVVMFMVAEDMRVGLVTEHLPVTEVAKNITKEKIIAALRVMNDSLKKDFGIDKPKIAVLGLNPHAGDEGLIGNEEESIIKPAIADAKRNNLLAFGPYSADAFFARGSYAAFDAVLAMYHDQGLIPFKSLAIGNGINYTAGLNVVRTSPDHGTAFDIAGKGIADATSFLAATYACVDIIRRRLGYAEARSNPMRKISRRMLANVEDERIEE